MVSFFKSFAKTKGKNILNGVAEMLVKADLSTATAAQLDMYDSKLAELSVSVASANADFQREQKEADDARADYNRKVEAAKRLRDQIAAEADQDRKASLEKSLAAFLSDIEAMEPNVKREMDEAQQAKEIYETYRDALESIRTKLADARQNLKTAAARIEKARLDEERSKELLAAKQAASGVTTSAGGLDTVMSTMSKLADDAERSAEANRIHAAALTPDVKPVDANIQAALDAVDGKTAQPADLASRVDRLSAL